MKDIIFSKKTPGLTLTNNEIKVTIKVNKSLENGEMFLKRITEKCSSQEGGLINFLCPLMKAGLALRRSVSTPLAKSVLILSGMTASASATYESIQ